MAMLLYERGLFDLDAPVCAIVPEFLTDVAKDPRRQNVTLRMLLAHSSGLPAYEKLFLNATTRDELLRAAFTMPLTTDPGSVRRLQRYRIYHPRHRSRTSCRRIPRPLLSARNLRPARDDEHNLQSSGRTRRGRIPPTADERPCGAGTLAGEMPKSPTQSSASQQVMRSAWRGRIIQGQVQDENAARPRRSSRACRSLLHRLRPRQICPLHA